MNIDKSTESSPQSGFSHVDKSGKASMVDITEKPVTKRVAVAIGYVVVQSNTIAKIVENDLAKGDVLGVSRIAGIQGAKKCADLIPLCHPLALSKVAVDFEVQADQNRIKIEAICQLAGKTGVEMEALTAVSTAALTLFDMCKAIDKTMRIEGIEVVSKEGGKSSW